MSKKLSIDEIKELYKDVLQNEDVTQFSMWVQGNHDDPVDDHVYTQKAINSLKGIGERYNAILDSLSPSPEK